MKYRKIFIVAVFFIVFSGKIYAAGNDARIGISLGGINWGAGIFGVEYDQKGIIQQVNWTAGGELDLLGGGFVISPRALYWQRARLSGFYGGPIVSFGVLRNGHLNTSYNGSYDDLLIGAGGEGGWLYRFPSQLDVGAAVNLEATNNGMWLGIKVTVGYLLR